MRDHLCQRYGSKAGSGAAKAIFCLIVLAVLAFGVWWETYAFRDCRKVGHSLLYCIGRLGQ